MPLSLPFIIHCASFHCASFTLKRGIALVEKEALPFHISFTMKRGTISHFTTRCASFHCASFIALHCGNRINIYCLQIEAMFETMNKAGPLQPSFI